MELSISEKYWIYSNYSKVQSLIYVLVICVAFTPYCILFTNGFIVGRSEDIALLRTHCQNCWEFDDFFFISLFKLTQRGVEFFVRSFSLSFLISKSQTELFLLRLRIGIAACLFSEAPMA